MHGLTTRQQQVLDAIIGFREAHGYSPTLAEIAEDLGGVSISTVHGHVELLIAANYLVRVGGPVKNRSLVPTMEASASKQMTEMIDILRDLRDATTDRKLRSCRRRARELLDSFESTGSDDATSDAEAVAA